MVPGLALAAQPQGSRLWARDQTPCDLSRLDQT